MAWPRVKNTSRRALGLGLKLIELNAVNGNNRDCFECLDGVTDVEWRRGELKIMAENNSFFFSRFIEINIWTSLVFEVSELMESR